MWKTKKKKSSKITLEKQNLNKNRKVGQSSSAPNMILILQTNCLSCVRNYMTGILFQFFVYPMDTFTAKKRNILKKNGCVWLTTKITKKTKRKNQKQEEKAQWQIALKFSDIDLVIVLEELAFVDIHSQKLSKQKVNLNT